MYQFHKSLLLVLGIDDSLSFGVRHAQCLKCSTRAAKTWFARYMALIHRGREATRVSKSFESFAPSSLMRGGKQDAIDIENGCGQRFGMIGPWSSQLADSHKLMHSEREKDNGRSNSRVRRLLWTPHCNLLPDLRLS